MLIHKKSVLSDKMNTMDLPVTREQVNKWRTSGMLIQDVFPNLTPIQRQFLLSGVTEEEWEKAFGDEDNIDPADLLKIASVAGKTVIIVDGEGNVNIKGDTP
jgi:hypothetical protein